MLHLKDKHCSLFYRLIIPEVEPLRAAKIAMAQNTCAKILQKEENFYSVVCTFCSYGFKVSKTNHFTDHIQCSKHVKNVQLKTKEQSTSVIWKKPH